jgi:HK97 gp10 family phage protein
MFSVKVNQKSRTVLLGIPRQSGLHKRGIRLALHDVGAIFGNSIKPLLTTGVRTGRWYSNLPNRSSAPGEPPQNQSGRLVRSYNYKVASWHHMTVGESTTYAGFLENGTRKMRPRPHMLVVANRTAGHVIEMLYRRANEQLK